MEVSKRMSLGPLPSHCFATLAGDDKLVFLYPLAA